MTKKNKIMSTLAYIATNFFYLMIDGVDVIIFFDTSIGKPIIMTKPTRNIFPFFPAINQRQG
jgi:hypothetical protein